MTDSLTKALQAVRDWHDRNSDGNPLPDFRHGDEVVRIGGDGTVFIIKGFTSVSRGKYLVRLMREDCTEVDPVPVHFIKPKDAVTIH